MRSASNCFIRQNRLVSITNDAACTCQFPELNVKAVFGLNNDCMYQSVFSLKLDISVSAVYWLDNTLKRSFYLHPLTVKQFQGV